MQYAREMFYRFKEHQLIYLGAQCAYFLLLSLFPFMIVMVSLLTFVPFTVEDFKMLLEDIYMPAGVTEVIEGQLESLAQDRNTGALSLGILFTLWTASLAINAILRSLNLSYVVTKRRGLILGRLISMGLTVGMFAVVVAALTLQVIGGLLTEWLDFDMWLMDAGLLRWILITLLTFGVFLALYLIGPETRLSFKNVYVGTIFATLGWQLTTLGFSAYLSNFADYSATYGAIGAAIVLMVWFHISALVILIGGEINAIKKEGLQWVK
ncbi:YihY/virulence factor BrkB family protein [Salisediminibacterium halotolerans]|uniref:YihY/virulence factor BrkB family protein n=1 Tax=Salisediminibacterium halotolerans TaxID=517425 RepID=UPI000EB17CA9|nr:YihY/virulence factor BrkB family protein [Salisediminibacterium halotolerans]RLJ73225.1 membrane protein [Actinophytocola xinjiangensis]RPE86647.1 membrane protein [Salisediminibacterium halotolerans]TWG34022.1 membrane protein [Salisediminibacterium halotolerans]GEL09078.1 putative ribonuclease-like protein YfkH [Salisediminibacterium halotolerans]